MMTCSRISPSIYVVASTEFAEGSGPLLNLEGLAPEMQELADRLDARTEAAYRAEIAAGLSISKSDPTAYIA